MTTFTTNQTEFLMVPVPVEASDFFVSSLFCLCHKKPERDMICQLPPFGNYEILGGLYPKEGLIELENVELSDVTDICSEARKRWSLDENPYATEKYPMVVSSEITDWQSAQDLVLPERLLILKKK